MVINIFMVNNDEYGEWLMVTSDQPWSTHG